MDNLLAVIVGSAIFLGGLLTGLRIGKGKDTQEPTERHRKVEYQTQEEKTTLGSGSVKPMTVKEKQFEREHGDEAKVIRKLLE